MMIDRMYRGSCLFFIFTVRLTLFLSPDRLLKKHFIPWGVIVNAARIRNNLQHVVYEQKND